MPAGVPTDRILGGFVGVYRAAELALTESLAKATKKAARKELSAQLAGATSLRERVEGIARRLDETATSHARDAVDVAGVEGHERALADLAELGQYADANEELPQAQLDQVARSLTDVLTPAHLSVTRVIDDQYRRVIGAGIGATIAGATTQRQAMQDVLDDFARRGVTGFTDRKGRQWELSAYAEMATRTAIVRASLEAYTAQLRGSGVTLVRVSDSPQECPLCRPWESTVLTLDPAGETGRITVENFLTDEPMEITVAASLEQARAAGLFHPNCFPGEVLASAPTGVRASDSRWYEGELVVIHTAGGDELPVTPNHPVLTPEGWVAAGALQVGQDVIRYRSDVERVDGVRPGDVQVETRIGEIHDALRESSPVPPVRVPAAAEQFHGDGGQADVEVVLTDSLLRDGGLPGRGEQGAESVLVPGVAEDSGLPGLGSLHEVGLCARHAADGVMSSGSVRAALPGGEPGHASPSGLGSADGDAALADPPADAGLADAEGGRELVLALAGQVAVDQVVHLGRREYAGHVYNLQSGGGWYTASGIVVHNCSHAVAPYKPGVTRLPTNTANPEGYRARQKLRALERSVRRAKRHQLTALDPAAKRRANERVKAGQAAIREHVKTTEAVRQPDREQLMTGDAQRAIDRHGEFRPELEPPRLDPDEVRAAQQAALRASTPPDPPAVKPKPVRKLTDDQLAEQMTQALTDEDFDLFDRLTAEEERRDKRRTADRERRQRNRDERERAQAEVFEQALAAGVPEEIAVEDAYGISVADQRRTAAAAALRRDNYRGRGFDELARASFRDQVVEQYRDAEDATRGSLITNEARRAGVDPLSLFHGPEARARKHASPELKEWWDQNGRLTLDEWKAQLLGDGAAARQFRNERGDFFT